jgi:glutaredoxin
MKVKHVEGRKAGDVFLYALSTCVWCRRAKKLLDDLGVAYSYIDVDLQEEDQKDRIKEEIREWNPACSYPTLVIDNQNCIVGYDEEKIRGALGT